MSIDEINPNEAREVVLERALKEAEQAFDMYATLHSAKGSQLGNEKAKANARLSTMCRNALEFQSDSKLIELFGIAKAISQCLDATSIHGIFSLLMELHTDYAFGFGGSDNSILQWGWVYVEHRPSQRYIEQDYCDNLPVVVKQK